MRNLTVHNFPLRHVHSIEKLMRSFAASRFILSLALVGVAYGGPAHGQTAASRGKKKPAISKPAAPAGPKATAADSSPLAEMKKSNADLKKVLQRQPPTWSPEADVKNSEVRKVVDG